MTDVHSLRNFGPKSTEWLNAIGIYTLDDVEALGVLEVYWRLKERFPAVTLNMLWGLQGALLDIPWNQLPAEMKADLKARALAGRPATGE